MCPSCDLDQAQVAPLCREAITGSVALQFDDPIGLQFFQPCRKQPVAEAGDCIGDLAKAAFPVKGRADDCTGPAFSDQLARRMKMLAERAFTHIVGQIEGPGMR